MVDRDVASAMAGSFLRQLPADLVDELMARGGRVDYPAGATVYRERSDPKSLLVVRGLVRVFVTSPRADR